MIDFRHETFLTLCSCNSFTKAAELLHITQPAVSQHIKHLEEFYGCKLFDTTNRKIRLTHQGKLLKEFTMTIFSDLKHFKENISLLFKLPDVYWRKQSVTMFSIPIKSTYYFW